MWRVDAIGWPGNQPKEALTVDSRAPTTPAMQSSTAGQQADHVVAAARAGDTTALEWLVRHYRPGLLRFLHELTGDPELADDLAQDAFLRAFERFAQLKNDAAFQAWLYRIARNLWISTLRWRRVRRYVSLDRPSAHTMDDRIGRPMPEIDGQAECDSIQQALAALSAEDREVILLRYEAGFGVREIAGILGISSEAAQKRVLRARDRFQGHYREREHADG